MCDYLNDPIEITKIGLKLNISEQKIDYFIHRAYNIITVLPDVTIKDCLKSFLKGYIYDVR